MISSWLWAAIWAAASVDSNAPAAAAAADTAPTFSVRLSRHEAIRLGVEHNLSLVVSRLAAEQKEVATRATWLAFTPTVTFGAHADQNQTIVTPLGPTKDIDYSAGIAWTTPIGTTIGATGDVLRDRADPTNPTRYGALSLSLRQPILKDGWLSGAALSLRQAQFQAQVEHAVFLNEVNRLVADIETAYWDLALAEGALNIKLRSLTRARQQFADTSENIRRGILAAPEIYVVEDGVVAFEQDVVQARQTLRLAQQKIAQILVLDDDALPGAEDEIKVVELAPPERQATLAEALAVNPRIGAQKLRQELAAVQLSHAWNQALPALNFDAAAFMYGQGYTNRTLWDQTWNNHQTETRVGLSLAVPLDWGAVQAQVEIARLENARQNIETQRQQQALQFEVDAALTDLTTNIALRSLARKQVELAELKLQAEQEKYQNGLATLVDVVRFQRDLDNALVALQRTIRSVHVGEAQLYFSQGTISARAGVTVK